jgi:hypothetical protein
MRQLGDDFFRLTGKRKEFVAQLFATNAPLSVWSLKNLGSVPDDVDAAKDAQVFTLQQDAIGAAMIVARSRGARMLSYAAFLRALKKPGGGPLADVLDPLAKFLALVEPGTAVWWRLKLFDQKLEALQESINTLHPSGSRAGASEATAPAAE